MTKGGPGSGKRGHSTPETNDLISLKQRQKELMQMLRQRGNTKSFEDTILKKLKRLDSRIKKLG